VRQPGLDLRKAQRHMPAQQALHLRPRAFEGDVGHVQAELFVQLVAEEVRQRAGTERCVRHLARIRLDPGRELGQRLRGHARVVTSTSGASQPLITPVKSADFQRKSG